MSTEETLARMIREAHELNTDNKQFGEGEIKFDPYLRLSPEQEKIAHGALESVITKGRKRKMTAAEAALLPKRVSMIVANAVHAHQSGRPVFYPRGHKHFGANSFGHARYAGLKPTIKALEALVRAGLIKVAKARNDPNSKKSSTLTATPKLMRLLGAVGIANPILDYCLDERHVLELRNEEKVAVPFVYDDEQKRMEKFLRDHNESVLKHVILLPGIDGEPDQVFSGLLKRVFSNLSWDQCGRFYSPYQTLKNRTEKQRARLTIDGRSVIELDYCGFQPRLCYHLMHLEYDADPYLIAALTEELKDRFDAQEIRLIAKLAMVIAINRDNREALWGHADKFREVLGRDVDCVKVMRICEQHHEAIAPLLYKATGMRLMNIESRICESVLEEALLTGKVVLPVHDSFICLPENEQWLRNKMICAYYKEVGFYPMID